MERELSVVIPTFNEKENLQILIPDILEVFRKNQIDGELIIVDDRSCDGSFQFLNEQRSRIPSLKVIFREPPASISKSWYEGFDAASKKIIVCIDADLCHNPAYFPAMLEKIGEFDIVIGSRYMNNRIGMMEDKSIFAVCLSIFGQFITRFVTGFEEYDTSHSFRMFKKDIFDAIKSKLKNEGNTFLIEFLYYAKRNGAKVTEIPIEYGKRVYGSTKLKISKEGLRYLLFIIKLSFQRIFSL